MTFHCVFDISKRKNGLREVKGDQQAYASSAVELGACGGSLGWTALSKWIDALMSILWRILLCVFDVQRPVRLPKLPSTNDMAAPSMRSIASSSSLPVLATHA